MSLDQRVIEKCQEVLQKTDDGNRLTRRELYHVQMLANNYHRLSKADTDMAMIALQTMIDARMSHPGTVS